jgi:hypothetical protein
MSASLIYTHTGQYPSGRTSPWLYMYNNFYRVRRSGRALQVLP